MAGVYDVDKDTSKVPICAESFQCVENFSLALFESPCACECCLYHVLACFALVIENSVSHDSSYTQNQSYAHHWLYELTMNQHENIIRV